MDIHNKGKQLHRKQSSKWKDRIVTGLQDTGFEFIIRVGLFMA